MVAQSVARRLAVARRLDRSSQHKGVTSVMGQTGTRGGRVRLGQQVVEDAVASHVRGQRVRLWDDGNRKGGVSELFLQITPAGAAGYYLRFTKPGGGRSDCAIGRASRVSVEQAREAARSMLSKLELARVDPVEGKRAAEEAAQARKVQTFGALSEAYTLSPPKRPRSKRTTTELRWRLDKHIIPHIGAKPYRELTRATIRECIRSIWKDAGGNANDTTGHRIANMCHADIKAVFAWAMNEDRAEANPAAFDKLFDDTPTKRRGKLTEASLKAIWEALEAERRKGWGVPSVLAIQLCFVTLQRPNEIAKAHRDDLHLADRVWRIHPSRSKTRAEYEVPLSNCAVELFTAALRLSNAEWVFPSMDGETHTDPHALTHRFNKTRRRLVEAKALASDDVQLYDARRFGRTWIEDKLRFPESIAEKVINHAEDRSIRRLYNVGDVSVEVRRAHEAWSADLLRMVGREVSPPANDSDAPHAQAATA